MRQKLLSIALTGTLFLSIAVPAFAVEQPAEIERAGAFLSEQGIYQGNGSGDLMLDKLRFYKHPQTRAAAYQNQLGRLPTGRGTFQDRQD